MVVTPSAHPADRWVLLEGLAPLPVPEHPGLAPLAAIGEVRGQRHYAERVPRGVRLDEVRLPRPLADLVVVRVLEAVAHLHAHRRVHGAIGADLVHLGADGSVVLCGRGRRSGLAGLDLIASVGILGANQEETLPGESAAHAAAELATRVSPGATAALAAWVRDHLPPERPPLDTLELDAGGVGEVDEVVPDLGPDTGDRGLLDPWTNTATGATGETTPAVRGESTSPTPNLTEEFWARVDGILRRAVDPPDGPAPQALADRMMSEPPDLIPGPELPPPPPRREVDPGAEDAPTIVRLDTPLPKGPLPVAQGAVPPQKRRWSDLALAVAFGFLLASWLAWLW